MNVKPYQYRVVCPVCGFKYYNWEMKKRWDGIMVCQKDWEPRHIADFYRTRNDVHRLPFILSDNQAETTWSPTVNAALTGASTTEYYTYDASTKLFSYRITIIPAGISFNITNPFQMTLPDGFVPATDHGGTVVGSRDGKLYSSAVSIITIVGPPDVYWINMPISFPSLTEVTFMNQQNILVRGSFTST